ncbi:MAG: hypothetical protein L0387_39300 [Acidobacteria bacterium]|nr:hypothetical protein [Acidobacteriota bacterium]
MPDFFDTFELEMREQDRECRKTFGFGLDEIPSLTPWETQIRTAAIDAVGAANHSGRRPTHRQLQKVEAYNQMARRYRALADAEFAVAAKEINGQIAAERAAGTYVEPGLNEGCRAMSVVFGLSTLALLMSIGAWSESWIWLLGGGAVTALLAACLWNVQRSDPRMAEAMRKRMNAYTYWKIIR